MASRQQRGPSNRPGAEVEPTALRDAMSRMPTGVTAITALVDGAPAGLAANAVNSLSLEPPLMFAAIDRGSRTLRSVETAGCFGVNVLGGAGGAEIARRFGRRIPTEERWRGVSWEAVETSEGPVPMLEEAIVWIGCRLGDVIGGGDHVIVTGEVLGIREREGSALLFHRGEYRALGE